MSATTTGPTAVPTPGPTPGPTTGPSTPPGRLRSLARAELALLGRNRSAVVTALFVPLVLPFSVRPAFASLDSGANGLSLGTAMLTAAIGFSLLFAVYSSLVGAFVARREELVLKRLRTGELGDPEILAGTALPSVCLGFAQSLLLGLACALLLDAGAPAAPQLVLLGLLLGLVLGAALAALTATFTRTVESAQVTALPFLLVSMLGSGIAVPAQVLPDRVARICALLPLSPAIRLISDGWQGGLSAGAALGAVATAVAWTVVAVFAVRRWFRWEPRR